MLSYISTNLILLLDTIALAYHHFKSRDEYIIKMKRIFGCKTHGAWLIILVL